MINKTCTRMRDFPERIDHMTVENYDDFLADRRKLMAQLMMRYSRDYRLFYCFSK